MTQYQEQIVGKPGGLVEPGVRQYGFLKKIFKKVKKGAKKVWKSPLGKIGLGALALGVPWGGGGTGGIGGLFGSKSAFGRGLGMLRNRGIAQGAGKYLASGAAGGQRLPPTLLSRAKKGIGDFGWGKAAFLGGGLGLTGLSYFGGGDEEEEIIDDWPGVANLRKQAQDYYKAAKPDYLGSPFMPPKESVMSGYYGSKEGGIVGLANGGPAEAQAEQMLRMEYQKYRNQGGTMSYQQFKMAVLQQAQGQGPMAQGQPAPQMAAYGGRMGYQGGELVEDASMIEETPTGLMEENVEEVQGEPTREQLEALAMEIFQLRLEELDEEQLMIVYQAAMEQQPEEMAMQEEDIQFDPQMVQGQMAQPQMAAKGGIMDLGGMEKDYRQEGGFVPLGGKEKADDVPARLSKNEFVFTADAVRAAGGGDIDQGAEVMENVMDNLESGGEISEESQGGGGEIISEEEIAEGPDGAQEMYDQQQMLQSRMA